MSKEKHRSRDRKDANKLKKKSKKSPVNLVLAGTGLLVLAAVPHTARAFQLYNGNEAGTNNLIVNLNITTSFSSFYRVNDPSAVATNDVNMNDGDLNFRHGFVGNTFEAVPVLDIKDGDLGAHFSGQMFLNTVYLQGNKNNSPDTINQFTPADNQSFTTGTRNVNGLQAQFLDAFAYDTWHFGADSSQSFELKAGQQTLLWGQSLFFTNNGIAAGQAPLDTITAQSLVNPQAQQVFLPVGQIVATYQPNNTYTIQGYYQYQWLNDELEGVGSYFSDLDFVGPGSQRLILVPPSANFPGAYLFQTRAQQPKAQNGQFGISVQATYGDYDLGLYALRYDSKSPQVILDLGAPAVTPNGISEGTYRLAYPQDIWIYGTSASTTLGAANIAGEISGRRNMPLVTPDGIATPENQGGTNNDPLYAVGSTIAAQSSLVYVTPPIPGDPGGMSILGEVEVNHVLSVTANKADLQPGRSSTAAAFDVEFVPTYYNVFRSINLEFPISWLYNFAGNSQIDGSMNHGTGQFSLGVTGVYRGSWDASLAYVDFLGSMGASQEPNVQQLSDRGYVTFNIQHTF